MSFLDTTLDAGLVARLFLGAVFLAAGFAKLRSRHWAVLAIDAGTPRAVVVTLPAAEAMLGLGLVVQLAGGWLGWAALALLAAFTVAVVHRYVSGSKAPCNCFGSASHDPVGRLTIARNVLLLVIAVVATT